MPPVVTGYVLLLLLGRRDPLGQFLDEHFGIVFAFRRTGAGLACAVMGFPLIVRAVRLSIEAGSCRNRSPWSPPRSTRRVNRAVATPVAPIPPYSGGI
jgi:ABC-type sulfate transport system permease subunit